LYQRGGRSLHPRSGLATPDLGGYAAITARRVAAGSERGADGVAGSALAGPAEGALTRAVTDDDLARALTDEALLARLVDDVIARAPDDPARRGPRPRAHLATLIPAGHDMAALATILLAVLTAVSAAR
jgi:hypothetical protein